MTTALKSVRVARETSWGSLSNGVPDTSGLSFYAAVLNDDGNVVQVGEPVMTDVSSRARSCIGSIPREPATIKDAAGDWIERRSGTFDLSMQINGIGDGSTITDWAEMPWYNLLRTCFSEQVLSTITEDEVNASGATVNSHTVVDASHFSVGQLFRILQSGVNDYAGVTQIVGDVITYSPALITAGAAGEPTFPMRQVGIGCQPPTSAPTASPDTISCAVELAGIGWKATAAAVTVDSYSATYTEATGRLDITFSCYSPFVSWEAATYVPVAPLCPAGGVPHHLNAVMKISDTGGTACAPVASPAALAATAYCLDEMSLSVTLERRDVRCGLSVLGIAGREITNVTVDGSVTLSQVTDEFDGVIWDSETRSIMIGFTSGDSTQPGEGAALYFPAAVFTGDPAMLDTGSTGYRTSLAFATSGWYGDTLGWQMTMAFGETYSL